MEREKLLVTLSERPSRLKDYPELQDDTDFIREAVQRNGYILCFASQRLRGDYETVMLALKNQGRAFEDIAEELKHRKDVVLAAVSSNGAVIEMIPKALRADWDVALAAASGDGVALKYIPEEFREKRELILAATEFCSSYDVFENLLPFIPKRFLSDKEVAIHLVSLHGYLYDYVDKKFRRDIDVLDAAVRCDSHIIKDFDEDILADKEYIKRFIAHDPSLIVYASDELRADKELALMAMNHPDCRYALEFLDPSMQADADVLRAFVANFEKCYARAYAFDEKIKDVKIPEALFRDDGFMNAVLDIYFDQQDQLENDTAMGADKAFVLRAVELGRDVSKLAAPALLEDQDVLEAMAAAEKRKMRKNRFSRLFLWRKRP